jgi:hypothetical protein
VAGAVTILQHGQPVLVVGDPSELKSRLQGYPRRQAFDPLFLGEPRHGLPRQLERELETLDG